VGLNEVKLAKALSEKDREAHALKAKVLETRMAELTARCSTGIRHTHHIHHIVLVVQYILQYSITIQYTHTLCTILTH
jgi:hypothetical protein